MLAVSRQVNWYRYLTNMAHREEFKYAAELADSAMTVIYLLLGIVACEWNEANAIKGPGVQPQSSSQGCLAGWAHQDALLAEAPATCSVSGCIPAADCKLGDSFDKSLPITSVLPPDAWKRLINLALLIRCLVACAWVGGWHFCWHKGPLPVYATAHHLAYRPPNGARRPPGTLSLMGCHS